MSDFCRGIWRDEFDGGDDIRGPGNRGWQCGGAFQNQAASLPLAGDKGSQQSFSSQPPSVVCISGRGISIDVHSAVLWWIDLSSDQHQQWVDRRPLYQ